MRRHVRRSRKCSPKFRREGAEKEDVELRREIEYAIEQLDAPEPHYEAEQFDIYSEYPKKSLPPFDVLDEAERLALFTSEDADVRAGAAHSFFNQELTAKARTALLDRAHSDEDASVRGEAWASLGDAVGDENAEAAALRDEMIAVLSDPSRAVEERGGAAVGLHAVADRDDVRKGLEALYAEGGKGRIRALEAMWRSLHQPYAKFFASHLDIANAENANAENKDPLLLRQALRGAGYFRITSQIDKIATFFDGEERYDDLREDALFAYALAMPGETSRGRVKGMLRKIDDLAGLSEEETELVEFALDERLRLQGLAPVFEAERAANTTTIMNTITKVMTTADTVITVTFIMTNTLRHPLPPHRKLSPVATIPAPAAAEKNTRSVTARNRRPRPHA